MLRLKRNVRVKDVIVLPNGKLLKVDFDVESNRFALVRAQTEAIRCATEWNKDPDDAAKQEAFTIAYSKVVQLVLTPAGYDIALDAYDGHVDELCGQLDGWIASEVMPKIEEASRRYAERLERLDKKYNR